MLVRCGVSRLSHIVRVTGEPLRRYEHPYPGSLIHVDVTKFGNIPDGSGYRCVGRRQGHANRRSSDNIMRGKNYWALIGTAFVHTVVDDNSRVAYAEICSDEKAATAVGVLERPVAWFAEHGVTVERVLSDKGSAYKSHAWCERTLADGWAYAQFYSSETARRAVELVALLTIITGTTPRSAARPSAGSTTSLNITAWLPKNVPLTHDIEHSIQRRAAIDRRQTLVSAQAGEELIGLG